jgi:hypothetical protein
VKPSDELPEWGRFCNELEPKDIPVRYLDNSTGLALLDVATSYLALEVADITVQTAMTPGRWKRRGKKKRV